MNTLLTCTNRSLISYIPSIEIKNKSIYRSNILMEEDFNIFDTIYILSDLYDIKKLLKTLENRSDHAIIFLIVQNIYDKEIYKIIKSHNCVLILSKKQFSDSKNIISNIINMNFGFMPYCKEDYNMLFPFETYDEDSKDEMDCILDHEDYIALLKMGYSYAATEEFIGKEPISNIHRKTINNFKNYNTPTKKTKNFLKKYKI